MLDTHYSPRAVQATQEDVSMDGDNEKDHEALNLLGFFTVSCFSECLSMKVVENCLNHSQFKPRLNLMRFYSSTVTTP